MKTTIKWLKASYIAGTIADGIIVILMMIPSRMGETEFRYSMGLAAALMLGWTLLLVWGNRKPMERKGILLITIFPVITGLIATGIWAYASGIFTLQKTIPMVILGMAIALLMGFSYLKARNAENESARHHGQPTQKQ